MGCSDCATLPPDAGEGVGHLRRVLVRRRGAAGLFRGGAGGRVTPAHAGTLSYVIRDSYGFPASDTIHGFGPPMRYLQTICGAPQHAGGAHWFPDTITVTVPFNRPA
jgi:hypothetical protein